MAAVTTDREIGTDFDLAIRRRCVHVCDPVTIEYKIGRLAAHPQIECREALGVIGQKIEKIRPGHHRMNLQCAGRCSKCPMTSWSSPICSDISRNVECGILRNSSSNPMGARYRHGNRAALPASPVVLRPQCDGRQRRIVELIALGVLTIARLG
jgi:hypothetical protein